MKLFLCGHRDGIVSLCGVDGLSASKASTFITFLSITFPYSLNYKGIVYRGHSGFEVFSPVAFNFQFSLLLHP